MRFGPSPTISVHRTLSFGPSDTKYRSIGHQSIGPSNTNVSVHQTPNPEDLPPNFSPFLAYPQPVTRARDLNHLFNVLTPAPSRRLKRGLRPLSASTPPNPPYPHKGCPTGEPKTKIPRAPLRGLEKGPLRGPED